MIDFVIRWVDGNDPKWEEEFLKYSNTDNNGRDNGRDIRSNRYRDWGNLQYWFRGVEIFAPWVNNIYFVTWGHYPKWLNINHPKLKIVKHSDYIPKEYLPTFTSRTIDLNLHRIKDLSEQFVLFDDDMFLLKPVTPSFFFKKGLPVDAAILRMISTTGNPWFHVVLNDVVCINKNFSIKKVLLSNFFKWFNLKYGCSFLITLVLSPSPCFPGFFNTHLPQPFLKSTFDILWEQEFDTLHKTCCSKFRNMTDINQYLVRYWQLVSGLFIPANPSKRGIRIAMKDSNVNFAANTIQQKKKPLININDTSIIAFEESKNIIKAAFDSILPNKSAFEL